MNNAVLFSTGKDNWETPTAEFLKWHQRFKFVCDVAANAENHKVARWFGPGGEHEDALSVDWPVGPNWLNPPYSRGAQKLFLRKAMEETLKTGACTVALVPARTDTKVWHEVVWDAVRREPRPWVSELHFLKGRLTFVGAPAGAPFPSAIIVFGAK